MNLDPQKIVEYETVIPTCIQSLSNVMPGIHAILRDDLVLIYSKDYPSADANRAFLLRETPERIDGLIDEVIAYFKERELPTTIMVSPACTPADLPRRLLKRGFVRQEPDECWLMMEHIQTVKVPKTDPKIKVKLVEKEDLGAFVGTMIAAYEMTSEWAPMLEKMLEPSIGLPNINNYLAFLDQKPVATVTTMHHKEYVVVGSGGVLPEHRGTGLLYNLSIAALSQARDRGADTVLAQTTAGPKFERFLRICGLKQAFKRQGYILE
ncbi:hypothetical protein ANAEL_04834 [Anaerolineales bacterium]|nr:hypothetical protein ANAEL_04834 [Anaerolineales bacterium]